MSFIWEFENEVKFKLVVGNRFFMSVNVFRVELGVFFCFLVGGKGFF